MNRTQPPGPFNGVLTVPHIVRLATRPERFVTDLARRFGDLVYYRLVTVPCYQINHPQLVREVLATKGRSFRKLPRQMNLLSTIFGNGLIVSHGDHWLRQRRLLQPAFHNQRMARYAHDAVDCTLRLIKDWPANGTVDIAQEMTRLMVAVTARTLFDVDILNRATVLGESTRALSKIFMREIKSVFTLPDWIPSPVKRRKRAAISALNGFIDDLIRRRRAEGRDHGDVLSMLLSVTDESGGEAGMSDRQVRDEAMTLLNAGYHASSAALAWLWHLLAAHPDVEARLADEVQRVLQGRVPTIDDLPQLQYVAMVVKESLRIYPPAWALFARQAVEAVELGGYTIPKGAWVFIYPWVLHRDARFFPQPECFDPERFAPGREQQIPPFAYIPFGGGPHQCIGGALSMAEMTLIVASMTQRLRLRMADRVPLRCEVHIAMRPVQLKMRVEPRRTPTAKLRRSDDRLAVAAL